VTAPNHVLLIGFDPHSVPGVDANLVDVAMAMGEEQLTGADSVDAVLRWLPSRSG
jgi:hypothetical protein